MVGPSTRSEHQKLAWYAWALQYDVATVVWRRFFEESLPVVAELGRSHPSLSGGEARGHSGFHSVIWAIDFHNRGCDHARP